MLTGKFGVFQGLIIALIGSVQVAQCCPALRQCFPDTVATVPCRGSATLEWTTEPSDTDCSAYVSCFNGVGIKMCCPEGTYYNPVTQLCDDESNVDCQIEPPPCETTTNGPDTTTTTGAGEPTTATTDSADTTTTTGAGESTTATTETADTTTTTSGSEESTTTTIDNADTTTTTTSTDESTTQDPNAPTTTTNDADTTTTTTEGTTSTVAAETTTVEAGVDLAALCAAQPTDSLVEVAYPGECSMYVLCENRQPVATELCPAGLHFNSILAVCDSPDHAECLEFVCQNNPEGSLIAVGSLNSCQRYFICIGNVTIERFCAPGTIYDAENGWCLVDDGENPCVPDRLPPPPDTVIDQCTEEMELSKIAHPTLCDVYFRCLNGRLWVRQCPAGLYFDPERGQCNLPDFVTCEEAPINYNIST